MLEALLTYCSLAYWFPRESTCYIAKYYNTTRYQRFLWYTQTQNEYSIAEITLSSYYAPERASDGAYLVLVRTKFPVSPGVVAVVYLADEVAYLDESMYAIIESTYNIV